MPLTFATLEARLLIRDPPHAKVGNNAYNIGLLQQLFTLLMNRMKQCEKQTVASRKLHCRLHVSVTLSF